MNTLTQNEMAQRPALLQEQTQGLDLENQQREQAIKSQAAMTRAFTESGGDLDKVPGLAATYGANGTDILNLNQKRAQIVANKAKTDLSVLNTDIKRHDELRGSALAYEGLPDDAKADPQNWAGYLSKVQKFDPEEYIAFAQNYPTYPGADVMKLHAAGLAAGSQLTKEAKEKQVADAATARANAAATSADTRKTESEAKLPGLTAKSEAAQLATAAQTLAPAADAGDKDSYARAWYQLDPKVAAKFPHPDDYDPDATADTVRSLGQTPQQQVTTSATAARNSQTATHEATTESQAQARLNLESQRLNKENGQTANSIAIDRRNAEGELRKLELQEAILNKQRRGLGAAITNSTDLKDKDGNSIDARGQYEDVTNQYKQLLADKYNAFARTGRGTPAVSYDDAIKALDGGGQAPALHAAPSQPAPKAATPPTPTPKPAAAPPKAAPPANTPAAKLTEADVRQWAADKHKDVDAALKMAREKKLIQ